MAPLWLSTLAAAAALVLPHVSAAPFEEADLPRGWKYSHQADPATRVTLYVSVRQQNVNHLEQLVLQMSDPDHPSYGQHLEGHEVKDILRPSQEASSSVISWLQDSNITTIDEDHDWVTFVTSVENANKMLNTDFAWFKHVEDDDVEPKMLLRTMYYHVPDHVAPHIDFVQPTTKFGSTRAMASTIFSVADGDVATKALANLQAFQASAPDAAQATAPPDAVCAETITPQCLLKLYNIHYGASATNGNKVSFGSFLYEYARYTDLTEFENTVASYTSGRNFSVIEFHGGMNDQTSTNDSVEANLDSQYILGVGHPVPITEYSTGGFGPQIPSEVETGTSGDNEPYLAFLTNVLKLSNAKLPKTLSVSYGDEEQTIPVPLANKVCNMFMQLGARGVSVIFSSGDFGPGQICENNNGTVKKFTPIFPAACPWVTSVGATTGVPTESAVSFSSGGFSNVFARPSYQTAVVATYLKGLGNKFSKYYNHTGRGFPDVAAQGENFVVIDKGAPNLVGGTSASAPTFSSVIALLNSARVDAGMPTLGFLNPFLYAKGKAGLTDITAGGSSGCANDNIPGASWNATKGWDPVTGLGTPNFGKLLKLTTPSACNIGGPLPNPSITACK